MLELRFFVLKEILNFQKKNRTKGYSESCITTSYIFHYKGSPNISVGLYKIL